MKVLRKPDWMKKMMFQHSQENYVKNIINSTKTHTVCQEARCPNIGECFAEKTATFLLLGNSCTRNCRFCNISANENGLLIDPDEPNRIVNAVKKLGLKFIVLTSVTRDDIPDGGASIFVETINKLKKSDPELKIEVLVSDFKGDWSSVLKVLNADIVVFAHNLETVERLYPEIRPMASYQRSLDVLKFAKDTRPDLVVKTGIMVGVGEREEEVEKLAMDFYAVGGDALTIGQYLPPGKEFYPVKEYIEPEMFKKYEQMCNKIGIKKVFSGPFVRSSYLSGNFFNG